MLSIKERQRYLTKLGYYTGKIDGIEGTGTKKAYKQLQTKYFIRKSDIDGIYGNNTEKLLINAYRVKVYTKNFKLEEFKCECNGKWCTGYHEILSINLLKNVQKLRNKYGSLTITSGLRCINYNSNIGGIRGSKHTQGKAVDFFTSYTFKSLTNRKGAIDWYIKNCNSVNYAYCDGYGRTKWRKEYPSVPTMYKSIHVDVK